VKLSHVAIGCADIGKMAAFYTKTLGLKEAFRMDREDGTPGIVYLDAGPDCFIELLNRGGEPSPLPPTGLSHVCLEVEDMEAELARLAELGITPETPPKRATDGNLQAWIRDPEGGRVELMELSPEGKQLTYRRA